GRAWEVKKSKYLKKVLSRVGIKKFWDRNDSINVSGIGVASSPSPRFDMQRIALLAGLLFLVKSGKC
ncbi:MAG: hypothetical protein KDM64_18540, partial [Verrucomicrobiae bacterium]|nr:hypothetical protein [Verrucomicrobiae bacterium]